MSDIDKGGDKLIKLISEIETDTANAQKEVAKFSTPNFVSHNSSQSSKKLTNNNINDHILLYKKLSPFLNLSFSID